MYKTLGEYSWSGVFKEPEPLECPIKAQNNAVLDDDTVGTITKSAQEFHLALENLKSVRLFVYEHKEQSLKNVYL